MKKSKIKLFRLVSHTIGNQKNIFSMFPYDLTDYFEIFKTMNEYDISMNYSKGYQLLSNAKMRKSLMIVTH